jgi:hypothetical protein
MPLDYNKATLQTPTLRSRASEREAFGKEVPTMKETDKIEKRKNVAKTNEEDDMVLAQLKRTQATIFIWGLLMASQKHGDTLLAALAEKEISIDTSPEEVLYIMGVDKI